MATSPVAFQSTTDEGFSVDDIFSQLNFPFCFEVESDRVDTLSELSLGNQGRSWNPTITRKNSANKEEATGATYTTEERRTKIIFFTRN